MNQKESPMLRYYRFGLISLIVLSASITQTACHFAPPFIDTPVVGMLTQSSSEKPESKKANQLLRKGEDYLDSGDFSAAVPVFEEALQIYTTLRSDRQTNARKGLASALLLSGEPLKAIPLFEQCAKQADNKTIRSADLSNLGLAYYQSGQFVPAERALQSAIKGWDSVRDSTDGDLSKITLFEQQAHTYRLLQKVLVAQGKYESALIVSEQSRARALVEQLVRGLGGIPTSAPTLASIRQVAKTHNTTLVEYSIVGDEVRVLGTELTTETHLFIWVVKPTGEISFRQVELEGNGDTPMRFWVKAARNEIIQQNNKLSSRVGSEQDPLKKLYTLLIEPIADLLPSDPDAVITIVPHGPLFLMPFASLKAPSGEYLIQAHTLLASPSIQVLGLTQRYLQQQKRQGNILVVANPTMPNFPDGKGRSADSLAALPGAEKEGEAIAALYNTTVITGDEATEEHVVTRIPSFQIIHLATHGLLDVDANFNEFGEIQDPNAPTARDFGVYYNPGGIVVGDNVFIGGVPAKVALAREKVVRVELPGLLAFAPGGEEDGFLTAKEIVQLSLNAELVVMSACDTGGGRITGDGVVGLSRSFMAAGVPSVMMSLWSVPDMSTATLMVEFYKNLKNKQEKAHALRQAMLTTMKKHPHPVDWASFVLMGETVSFCSNVLTGSLGHNSN